MTIPLPPALSTMWLQLRYDNLAAFALTARTIGFSAIELSHVVTSRLLDTLPDTLPVEVRVLHHPCPNPGGIPELSDPDEPRRRAAVAAARRTIEQAGRLGARAVVIHPGLVGVDRRWENALRARWLQGERDELHFEMLGGYVEGLRAAQAEQHLNQARRSLETLVAVAEREGVRIGLENGEWVMSVPTLEEAATLLKEFDSPSLGLWLDTGHATILERLGFGSLEEWAALAGDRLIGVHYHDVAGLRDHVLPGRGSIAWGALRERVFSGALPTCEFDWYYTPEELAEGAAVLARHGLIAWGSEDGTADAPSG